MTREWYRHEKLLDFVIENEPILPSPVAQARMAKIPRMVQYFGAIVLLEQFLLFHRKET